MVPIGVAFTPQLLPDEAARRGVCVVIDVLRATSTLTTLLERGIGAVSVAGDVAAARRAKERDPQALLIGEIGGVRPPDFDLGNSPLDITPAVAGRRAICHTSNGTAAIRSVADAPAVFLGCLRNAAAVAGLAFRLAHESATPITVLCSGGSGGRAFALDDALTAGQIVLGLAAAAREAGVPAWLDDAASAAVAVRQTQVGPEPAPAADRWLTALRATSAGRHLESIGLGADVPFCAQVDRTNCVPMVQRRGDGITVIPAGFPPTAVRA